MRIKIFLILISIFLVCAPAISYTIDIVRRIGGFTNAQACEGHRGIVYILDYHYVIAFDPASGTFIDTLNVGEYIRGMAFSGDVAVVVGMTKLFLVDVSNPRALVQLDWVAHGGTSGWKVAMKGNMVYAAVHSKVAIYEVVGSTLTLRGNYFPSLAMPIVMSVAIKDSIMYCGLGDPGIVAVNVSNPTLPVVRMSANTPGSVLDLKISGDLLVCSDGVYVGVDTGSVRFFRIPSPSTITPLGYWSALASDAMSSFIVGNRLALADGEGGVRIIDFSNPLAPIHLVRRDVVPHIRGVFVSGDTIYAAGSDTFYIMTTDAFIPDTTTFTHTIMDSVQPPRGLMPIMSCPTSRWFVTNGSCATTFNPSTIVFTAGREGILFGDARVRRYPVSGGWVFELALNGSAYAPGETLNVGIVLIRDDCDSPWVNTPVSTQIIIDASTPALSSVRPAPGAFVHPDSVRITGQLVDVGPAGLVVDSFLVYVRGISYSTAGMYLSYSAPNFVCNPLGIFRNGDTVNVCIHAVDAVRPQYCGPNKLDTCWTFFVRTTDIPEREIPKEITLKVFPNPFNSSCRIISNRSFNILDLKGKIIETIIIPENQSRVFDWDGSNFSGEQMPSGIYLVRTIDRTKTERILMLK